MEGSSDLGYSGKDLDLTNRNIPIKLSPNQNAAMVDFKWSDNFPEFEPSSYRYSLSISPLVQRSQTYYFTIDVPTSGPVQVWGKDLKSGEVVSFGTYDNFQLSGEDTQRLVFSIDFNNWIMNLESSNMKGSIPLLKSYQNLNLNGLELGLSQIPKESEFLEAMNLGTGTYAANFQSLNIGSMSPNASSDIENDVGAAGIYADVDGDGDGDGEGDVVDNVESDSGGVSVVEEDVVIATTDASTGSESWDQVHSSMVDGLEAPVAEPSGNPQLLILILVGLLIFFLVMMAKK